MDGTEGDAEFDCGAAANGRKATARRRTEIRTARVVIVAAPIGDAKDLRR